MKILLKYFSITFILLIILFPGFVKGQNWTKDEKDLIKTAEHFLFNAGNYNLDAMAEMMTEHANVGIARIKDGRSEITTMTIQQYIEDVRNRTLGPYYEPVREYTIHVNDGRLAFVRADATLYAYGIPQSHNMDYFTLIKDGEYWKFLSLSYSPTPVPDAEKVFNLNIFGQSYARAWCSQRPDFVSLFYSEDGSLSINDGKPAVGRNEISKAAESFMTAFPDIIVSMDSLVTTPNGTEFHWTFTGTNTGPNGTGKKVKISGVEVWRLNEERIKESKGKFDTKEYERQIKNGVENYK